MANETINRDDNGIENNAVTVTPKNTIGKGTLVMIGAAILFLIIAAVLFTSFLNAPTGGSNGSSAGNSATNQSRANP